MEKGTSSAINTILEPINERLRGPFTGAFLISWIFINWKVLVLIFAYDYNKEVSLLFDIVETKYLSPNLTFWFPLLSAICYIVIAPLSFSFASIIKEFFLKKVRDYFVIKINKLPPTDQKRYNSTLNQNLVLQSELSILKQANFELKQDKVKVETEKRNLETANMILEKANVESMVEEFYSFFSGTWELEWKNKKDGRGDKELVRFDKEKQTYLYSPNDNTEFEPIFRLEAPFIDRSQKKVCFTKIDIARKKENNNTKRVLFNMLNITDDGNKASGDENEDYTRVIYKKLITN